MKKKFIFIIAAGLLFSFSNSKNDSGTANLKLHWKYELGKTTHRSEIALFDNSLFIGSNGSHYMDYNMDENNGVVELNRKTGNKIKAISNEQFGDMDVNGIIRFENSIIFGNDNDELLCYSKEGEMIWRLPTSGDVEHAPILLNNTEFGAYVIFATETGEVRAINPKDGTTIWVHYNEQFNGWKLGDNRTIFKIKMHFTSGNIYFSKPAVADLNQDGFKDLIYSSNREIIAINGKTGKKLWGIDKYLRRDQLIYCKSDRETPNISGFGSKFKLTVAYYKRMKGGANDIIEIVQYDRKGKEITSKQWTARNNSWGESLNHAEGFFITNGHVLKTDDLISYKLPYTGKYYNGETGFRFYGDLQIAEQKLKIDGEKCIGILFQNDLNVKDMSMFMIMGEDSKKIYLKSHIPGGSEFTPVIEDINKDGKLDLLVSSWDNNLYCYDMDIPNASKTK